MKKRVKKQKSILQDQSCKQCYLCMLLEGDYREKLVEDHHIYFGSNRRNSEIHGFKVNLCIHHHREGKEAVHQNRGKRPDSKETLPAGIREDAYPRRFCPDHREILHRWGIQKALILLNRRELLKADF